MSTNLIRKWILPLGVLAGASLIFFFFQFARFAYNIVMNNQQDVNLIFSTPFALLGLAVCIGYAIIDSTQNDNISQPKDLVLGNPPPSPVIDRSPNPSSYSAFPSVDLDYLGVHSMLQEAIDQYNSNNRTGIFRSWLHRKKFDLQSERLTAFLGVVNAIREHYNTLEEFKAEIMTHSHTFPFLMQKHVLEIQHSIELLTSHHQTELLKEDLERENAKQQLLSLKLENDLRLIKVHQEEAKTRITQLRGKLIEKFIDELDVSNLNMKHVFVLIEMIKDSSNQKDFTAIDEQLDKLKAEAAITHARADIEKEKARKEKSEADVAEEKAKATVYDFKKTRD